VVLVDRVAEAEVVVLLAEQVEPQRLPRHKVAMVVKAGLELEVVVPQTQNAAVAVAVLEQSVKVEQDQELMMEETAEME
jgi:hypothetical protein